MSEGFGFTEHSSTPRGRLLGKAMWGVKESGSCMAGFGSGRIGHLPQAVGVLPPHAHWVVVVPGDQVLAS